MKRIGTCRICRVPVRGVGESTHLERWIHDEMAKPQVLLMDASPMKRCRASPRDAEDEIAKRNTDLPKVVFSKTLREPLTWNNSRLTAVDAVDEVRALKEQPGEIMDVNGGSWMD